MKKFLSILLVAFVATIVMQAQDNTNYLAKAFELLLEGNVESAEKHYIVHKKLTGQTDADFEAMLEGEKRKSSESWKDQCYIVPLNSEYMLAVQKASITDGIKLEYYDACKAAEASRLGDFTDWRVPTEQEMSILVANLSSVFNNTYTSNYFWTTHQLRSTETIVVNRYNAKERRDYTSKGGYEYDYVIVRKFLRK